MKILQTRETKFFFSILICLFTLASCKQKNDVGLPGAESINALQTDTFTLVTTTVAEDSIRTDELNTFPIGSIGNDPVFGSSTSNFFTQFLLMTDNWTFGTGVKFDSVVLTMAYTGGFYGDSSSIQKIQVSELSDEIAYNTNYFSNIKFNYQNNIGTWQGLHHTKDSVSVKGTNAAPHLRIKLSDAFGQKIIANGKTWLDNPDFLNTFKGLAITAENMSSTGCQVYFDPTSPYSAVTVYYNDSMKKDFSLYTNGARSTARINQFQHQYSTFIKNTITQKRNADTCYIQAQAGCKLKLELPTLFNIANQNPGAAIVVHGAELVVRPLDGSFTNDFPKPVKLLLVKCDSLGNNSPILDLYLSSFDAKYLGGTYNTNKAGYSFNFLNEVQELFKNYAKGQNTNYGYFVLIPGDNPMSASRMLVDTRKTQKQIQFKLTYSVVK